MTLQQLRYIVEVSKCSTISKAAQSLFLTQPTLSKAIKDLETELGIVILERGTTKTRFTADGTELLCYAKQLLEQAQAIEDRFVPATVYKKRLTVSTKHYTFSAKAFINMVKAENSEAYEFNLREGCTEEVIDDVFNKISEIGILFIPESAGRYLNRLLQAKDIEFTPIKSFQPHAFVNKKHPIASLSSVTLKQLEEYPCAEYEQESKVSNFYKEPLIGGNIQKLIRVRDRATMYGVLTGTDSYHINLGSICASVFPDMASVPIAGHRDKITVGWIKLKNSETSRAAAEYIALLEKDLSAVKCKKKQIK